MLDALKLCKGLKAFGIGFNVSELIGPANHQLYAPAEGYIHCMASLPPDILHIRLHFFCNGITSRRIRFFFKHIEWKLFLQCLTQFKQLESLHIIVTGIHSKEVWYPSSASHDVRPYLRDVFEGM